MNHAVPAKFCWRWVKFDDRQSSSWIPGYSFNIPPTQLIHVDIDPEELGRNYPPTLGIQADAKSFMGELCRVADLKIKKTSDSTDSWLYEIRNWREDWTEFNREPSESDAIPIRPERLLKEMRKVLPREAIVVCDVGEHHNLSLIHI